MSKQTDLVYSVLQILHAFYWVMADILESLEDSAGKVSGELKFHLVLAYKRCSLIVEHLKIALEEAEIKPDKRLEDEELRKRIGTLSIETLENVRSTLKGLIGELGSSGKYDVFWLASKLVEFADIICVASGLLKLFSDSLKNGQEERVWRIYLILQTIIQDLEIIVNMHRHLASNPEMLAKDLKLKQ